MSVDSSTLHLSQNFHLAQFAATDALKKTALAKLMESVHKDEMAPFYSLLQARLDFPLDKTLLASLVAKNTATLAKLEEKAADELLGETEKSDALIAIADHYYKIGDKAAAEKAYDSAYEKTGPLGHRIDIVFSLVRIGFFFRDHELINKHIDSAKILIEKGGDWDRRNRLKVYEGLYRSSIRDFVGSADMLLDTLATFTSDELMEYKDFVQYSILAAALVLKRPDFKTRVIDAPEILEVIHEIPIYAEFANSLYNCNYAQFFKSLALVEQHLKYDCYMSEHYQYYVREMRILAYAQLLESYSSLTIASMAKSFGVSEEFIDNKYIAAGRVNAVIDKVGGIVETNRPDSKNAQYQNVIKQGDLLLNRIQKLGRVVQV